MGLAFSQLPISRGTISADPATFADDLHDLLDAAGWTSAAYSTGKVYAVVSPQGLAAQVRIWDESDPNFAGCLTFQWVTSSSPISAGLKHHLLLDAGWNYAVWANCCQLFIGRPTVTPVSIYPYSVSGGVPWADGLTTPTAQCDAQSPASPDETTEMWWSCGADSGVANFAVATVEDLRRAFVCQRYSFCRNGVVISEESATETNAFQLGPLRAPGYYYYFFAGIYVRAYGFFNGGIVWDDGDPLLSEPLVLHRGVIYGQLWDACLGTEPMAKEATETVYESAFGRTTTWINYMHQNSGDQPRERFYALLLLTGITGDGVSNIAY